MAIKHLIRVDGKGKTKVVDLTARKAILAHCKECMGFDYNEVKKCTAPLCALFLFKTYGTPKSIL